MSTENTAWFLVDTQEHGNGSRWRGNCTFCRANNAGADVMSCVYAHPSGWAFIRTNAPLWGDAPLAFVLRPEITNPARFLLSAPSAWSSAWDGRWVPRRGHRNARIPAPVPLAGLVGVIEERERGWRLAPLNLRLADSRSRLRPSSLRSPSLRSHVRIGLAVEWLDAHALVWSAATIFFGVRYDARFLFVHDAAMNLFFLPSAAGLER